MELDIQEKWGIDGFDCVIGNPPFKLSPKSSTTLWDKFTIKSLNEWLKPNGYFLFVIPQGWRQLDNKVGKLMLSKQLLYLNMNDAKVGQKIFKCSTTIDYFILHNRDTYKETLIDDYKNDKYSYDLKNARFIPNHSIEMVNNYIDYTDECGIIKDRSLYGTEKKWMSKTETEEYKYPCIYTIRKNNDISLRYSKIDRGHFGITKYILSNGSGYYKDNDGKYGCTEWSYYIKCNEEDLEQIEKCFQDKNFLNIVDAVKLTSNKYNYFILKYLKKNFWSEFI